MLASVKMRLNLRESNKIESSFQNYVACLVLNREDESNCPISYRQYIYINLGLTVLYTWPKVIAVFLLYFSAYKKVRKLWHCSLTDGLCDQSNAEI